jgi:Xaa-Pro aminopeptidase
MFPMTLELSLSISATNISPPATMATGNKVTEESERAAYLLDAQTKAAQLFEEIERDLIRPGISEKTLSDEIHELGTKRHNVRTHWHKRVVRSGPNTLFPYAENPPARTIQPDDILFVDLGPVFEAWEADFGRSFVLGDDPVKKKLNDALEPLWTEVKGRFRENPDMTGEELYDIACDLAQQAGWEFGGKIAGHLVGNFPHERIPNDKITLYITKGNKEPMSNLGADGQKRHWILEIHLVDRARQIGAFYEQLLTVG